MNPSSTEWTFCDGSKKRLEEMSEQELVDALRAIALVKAANEMVKDRLPGGSVPLLENFRGLRLDQRKSLL